MKNTLAKIWKILAIIAFAAASAFGIYSTVVTKEGEVKLENIKKADSLTKNAKDSLVKQIDSVK